MNNYFYVDVDDEITSVIGRLRKESSDEVFLVVPKRAIIAQSLVNLKLLGKEAGKLRKNLIFVSPDSQTRKIAEKAGLSVKKYVAKPKEKPREAVENVVPSKKRALEHWEEEAATEELKKVISKPKPPKPVAVKPPTKIKPGIYSVPKPIPLPASVDSELKPVVRPLAKARTVEPKKVTPAAKPQVVNLKELAAQERARKTQPAIRKKELSPGPIVAAPPAPSVVKPQFVRVNPFKIKKIEKRIPAPEILPAAPEPAAPSPAPIAPTVEIPEKLERETANLTIKEKERLRDLWMEQKGIIRGKSLQENTNLDLNAKEPSQEELVTQAAGIFQTTHRRVIGSGKVIDLRATKSVLAGTAEFPTGKIPPKSGKEVLLPLLNVKLFVVFIIGILVILIILAGIIIPEANISITPKSTSDNLAMKFWASGEVAQADPGERTIPAKAAHFKVNEEKTFSATGEKQIQENSQGQVTVYNNANKPLSLKQNAMLTDSSGNKFYTTGPVTIPAAKPNSSDNTNTNTNSTGTVKAGSGSVAISAEKADKDYNLKVGDSLTIPGLSDGDYLGLVTVEISQEIKKGENRTAKIITQEDLDNAKNELTNQAKQDSPDQIKNNFDAAAAKLVRPEDLVTEDTVFNSDKKVGQEADSFTGQAEVSFFALAISQEDLQKLAKNLIESDREDKNGTVKINNYSISDPHPLENKAEISVDLDYQVVSPVDPNEVRKAVLAKKKSEAEDYLKGRSDIAQHTLNIWPNILGHLPVLERRIKIEVN